MLEIGDTVFERLQIGDSRTTRPYEGTVIYIHPKRRFYRAEFKLPMGTVIEAFQIFRNVIVPPPVDERHKRPKLAEFNRNRWKK